MRTSGGGLAVAIAAMLAGTALAAPRAPLSADDRGRMGVEAWQRGDFAGAVGIWRPLAEGGNPDAQFDLAQAYRLGKGVAVDMTVARDLYCKAGAQGHPQAQANCGLMLFQAGDKRGAMPMLQKAADAGDPRAQYVVGTALNNGDLLPKDMPRAYALMTRAAAAGLPPAANSLKAMDSYMTLEQRQQGMRLAQAMQRGATVAAAPPPAAAPIRTVDLPPSAPVRPAPPPPRATSAATRAAPPPAAAPRRAPPAPVPPPAPVAVAARGGGWRVQLGAFSSADKAQSLWAGLSHKVAALGGRSPFLVKAGAVTRLQAGPFASKAAADQACAAVKTGGQPCFAVPG